jgi:tRNA-binding protein
VESINFDDFLKVEIRVGTVLEVRPFPNARKPAFQMRLDFGEIIGERWTSAQITTFYSAETLIGRQLVAVVNFQKKQIANFFSECLVLGPVNLDGSVVLLMPERAVENGTRVG